MEEIPFNNRDVGLELIAKCVKYNQPCPEVFEHWWQALPKILSLIELLEKRIEELENAG